MTGHGSETLKSIQSFATAATIGAICWLAGCASPLAGQYHSRELLKQVLADNQQMLSPIPEQASVQTTQPQTDLLKYLNSQPHRFKYTIKELDDKSGPKVYNHENIDFGPSLDGEKTTQKSLTLADAVRIGIKNNLDTRIARISPAIAEAAVIEAEANFDAEFFTNVNFSDIQQPQQVAVDSGIPLNSDRSEYRSWQTTVGVRKRLVTGGILALATGFDYMNQLDPDTDYVPDPAFTSNVQLQFQQSLLRNFGPQVNRAQIALSKNAKRKEVLRLHAQMIQTIGQIEAAYWKLAFARYRLAIQHDLLRRTLQTRDLVRKRIILDATAMSLAQACSYVEQRRGEVATAQKNVRNASDELKRLLNSTEYALSSEDIIVPIDKPVVAPIRFSLYDTVKMAMINRPEMRSALLDIDDASIRQMVADNQRLPELTLQFQTAFRGMKGNLGGAYGHFADNIDYLVGLQFAMPIGNRAAEAAYRRSLLERRSTALTYVNTAQDVVLSVKQALREIATTYRLMATATATRRAAEANLEAIETLMEHGQKLSPDFLIDRQLNTQSRLAEAEIAELSAVLNYNIALVNLRQATGTLLEHNRIKLQWPTDMFNHDLTPAESREQIARDFDQLAN